MVWGKSACPVFRESGCRRKWPHFCAAVRPGKCARPLDAAPLAPPCRRVKDARYRPAHGCVVRGVVLFFVPSVEFTRSGAWGVCFEGFSREIGSEISRICLSFGVLSCHSFVVRMVPTATVSMSIRQMMTRHCLLRPLTCRHLRCYFRRKNSWSRSRKLTIHRQEWWMDGRERRG